MSMTDNKNLDAHTPMMHWCVDADNKACLVKISKTYALTYTFITS